MAIRCADGDVFANSRQCFDRVCPFLGGEQASALDHGELEDQLADQGRRLLRQLYQDHLDLRAEREARLETVLDADGVPRRGVEVACISRPITCRVLASPGSTF